MQERDFFQRLVDCSTQDGFSFLITGQDINEPQRAKGAAFLVNVAFGVAFGLLSPASAGYSDKFDKKTLVRDLEGMRDCCDLIGISFKQMMVRVRLGIDGDKISGEALVGRCAKIHERLEGFRKYAMSLVKTWISDVRQPTVAETFIMFSEHKIAKTFIDELGNKCTHYTYRKQLSTQAIVVDLEDELVTLLKKPLTPKPKVPAGLFERRDRASRPSPPTGFRANVRLMHEPPAKLRYSVRNGNTCVSCLRACGAPFERR